MPTSRPLPNRHPGNKPVTNAVPSIAKGAPGVGKDRLRIMDIMRRQRKATGSKSRSQSANVSSERPQTVEDSDSSSLDSILEGSSCSHENSTLKRGGKRPVSVRDSTGVARVKETRGELGKRLRSMVKTNTPRKRARRLQKPSGPSSNAMKESNEKGSCLPSAQTTPIFVIDDSPCNNPLALRTNVQEKENDQVGEQPALGSTVKPSTIPTQNVVGIVRTTENEGPCGSARGDRITVPSPIGESGQSDRSVFEGEIWSAVVEDPPVTPITTKLSSPKGAPNLILSPLPRMERSPSPSIEPHLYPSTSESLRSPSFDPEIAETDTHPLNASASVDSEPHLVSVHHSTPSPSFDPIMPETEILPRNISPSNELLPPSPVPSLPHPLSRQELEEGSRTRHDSDPKSVSSSPDSPRIPRKKLNLADPDTVGLGIGSESVCRTVERGTRGSGNSWQEIYGAEAGLGYRIRCSGMGYANSLLRVSRDPYGHDVERREPRCIDDGFVTFRPLLEQLEEQSLFQFVDIFKSITAPQKEEAVTRQSFLFSEATTELARWYVSLPFEIGTSLYKTKREERYQPLTSKVLSRSQVYEGIFVETISNCERSKLLPYDCVYHTSPDGLHIIGLVVSAENEYDLSGVPVLVLDWFPDYAGRGEIFYVGNVRHEMERLRALDGVAKPTSPIASTLSAFVRGEADKKWDLFEDLRRKPLLNPELVFRAVKKCNVASKYLRALRKRSILNEQQGNIVARALACCESWVTTRDSERSELNRFLLVSGVPGCGKTYTAVYLIATFLMYFNPEFARADVVTRWGGQVLVLTKTNKALDVFLQRLDCVLMPSCTSRKSWTRRGIPCFCKRSVAYLSREGCTELGRKQTDNADKINDVPVILSTFGNLANLCAQMRGALGGHIEAEHWVSNNLKAAIIDEGSQSVILDLLYFVTLFPTFDGVLIIKGDNEQMGPLVLTNMKEAKEYLSRSLFTEFSEIRSHSGFIVPHVEMSVQYRMHKDIMNLANDVSYRGKMVYGPPPGYHDEKAIPREVYIPLKSGDYHTLVLGPVVAYTTSDAPNKQFQCSYYVNRDELEVARVIISAALSDGKLREKDIVFLSPYKQQCSAMRRLCSQRRLSIGIHTVASFQGQEGSLIIYSLVRRCGGGTGFLDQKQMTFVAMTRPQDRLIFIGDLSHFNDRIVNSSVWKDIIASMLNRGTMICPAEDLLHLPSMAGQEL